MIRFQDLVHASLNRWPDETIATSYCDQLSDSPASSIVEAAMSCISSNWTMIKPMIKSSIENEDLAKVRDMLVNVQGFSLEDADKYIENTTEASKILVQIIVSQAVERKYPALFAKLSNDDSLRTKFLDVMNTFYDKIMEV